MLVFALSAAIPVSDLGVFTFPAFLTHQQLRIAITSSNKICLELIKKK